MGPIWGTILGAVLGLGSVVAFVVVVRLIANFAYRPLFNYFRNKRGLSLVDSQVLTNLSIGATLLATLIGGVIGANNF